MNEEWIVFDRAVVISRVPEIEDDIGNSYDASAGSARKTPIEQIIEATIREVRTAIAACPRNRLHPETTRIPLSLVNDACSLVSYYFATRMPGTAETLAQDPRYQAWREAKDKLKLVATCEIPVEDYATGEVSGGELAAAEIVVDPADRLRFTRRDFDLL